jgi:hypothetical protein
MNFLQMTAFILIYFIVYTAAISAVQLKIQRTIWITDPYRYRTV